MIAAVYIAAALVSVQNVADLVSNANERAYCTQRVQGSNVTQYVTNAYPVASGADPTGLTWREYDTGGVATVRAYAGLATTNEVDSFSAPAGYTYGINPVRLLYTERRHVATNRFIWGPYETYTLSGMDDSNLDGTYTWLERRTGPVRPNPGSLGSIGTADQPGSARWYCTVDIYTNGGAGMLFDYGPHFGRTRQFFSTVGVVDGRFRSPFASAYVMSTNFYPFGVNTWWDDPDNYDQRVVERGFPVRSDRWVAVGSGASGYDATNIVTAYGALLTNYYRDANFWTIYTEYNTTDKLLDWFADGPIFSVPTGNPEGRSLVSNAVTILTTSQPWADTNYSVGGVFTGLATTADMTYIPATNLYLDTVLDAATNSVTITNVTVASSNLFLYANERAAQQAWTWDTGTVLAWTAAGESNQYRYTGTSTNSWAEAIANAEAASADQTNMAALPPYTYTTGVFTPGDGLDPVEDTWQARGYVRRARLVRSGYYTNRTHDVEYYARGDQYGDQFHAHGTGLTNGALAMYSDYGGSTDGVVTSAWLGAVSCPTNWCAQPFVGTNTSSGYVVSNNAAHYGVISKWEF